LAYVAGGPSGAQCSEPANIFSLDASGMLTLNGVCLTVPPPPVEPGAATLFPFIVGESCSNPATPLGHFEIEGSNIFWIDLEGQKQCWLYLQDGGVFTASGGNTCATVNSPDDGPETPAGIQVISK
jgi:hypothetical protein